MEYQTDQRRTNQLGAVRPFFHLLFHPSREAQVPVLNGEKKIGQGYLHHDRRELLSTSILPPALSFPVATLSRCCHYILVYL